MSHSNTKVDKQTFDHYAARFKEITNLDSTSHPEAFMQFCNHMQLVRIINHIKKAFPVEDE